MNYRGQITGNSTKRAGGPRKRLIVEPTEMVGSYCSNSLQRCNQSSRMQHGKPWHCEWYGCDLEKMMGKPRRCDECLAEGGR